MVRLLTAFLIIGLSAFAVIRGWSVVQFARAELLAPTTAADAYRPWVAVPGVTSAALDTGLRREAPATGVEAARRRADMLSEALAARPLASAKWLALAGMRLVTSRPYSDTLAALAMSSITGPNSGAVMWQRGVFGLLQWDALSADARGRTVADLSGMILSGVVTASEIGQAKAAVGMKLPEAKSQIRAMLGGEGTPAAVLTALGL